MAKRNRNISERFGTSAEERARERIVALDEEIRQREVAFKCAEKAGLVDRKKLARYEKLIREAGLAKETTERPNSRDFHRVSTVSVQGMVSSLMTQSGYIAVFPVNPSGSPDVWPDDTGEVLIVSNDKATVNNSFDVIGSYAEDEHLSEKWTASVVFPFDLTQAVLPAIGTVDVVAVVGISGWLRSTGGGFFDPSGVECSAEAKIAGRFEACQEDKSGVCWPGSPTAGDKFEVSHKTPTEGAGYYDFPDKTTPKMLTVTLKVFPSGDARAILDFDVDLVATGSMTGAGCSLDLEIIKLLVCWRSDCKPSFHPSVWAAIPTLPVGSQPTVFDLAGEAPEIELAE